MDQSGNTLTKKALIEQIAENHNLTKKDATEVVTDVFELIGNTLKNNGVVDITGFGKFAVKERKSRTGVNPRTKEKIKINATKVPGFKPSKTLKEKVK